MQNRIVKTYTQHIAATPERIFPLLCPVREMDWLDGWSYEMVYSESGVAEKGCVFKNRLPGDADTVWVVADYDPENYYIQFVRVTPEFAVVQFDIQLKDNTDGTSDADLNYVMTALSEQGQAFIEGFAGQFEPFMAFWEKAINHYLQTGEILRRPQKSE